MMEKKDKKTAAKSFYTGDSRLVSAVWTNSLSRVQIIQTDGASVICHRCPKVFKKPSLWAPELHLVF